MEEQEHPNSSQRPSVAVRTAQGPQLYMDAVDFGMLLFRSDGTLELANHAALNLLGVNEDELRSAEFGARGWNVIRDDGSEFPVEEQPVATAIRSRVAVQNVIVGVHRPARRDRIWLLVDAYPKLSSDASVERVICTLRDFGEYKRAFDRLVRNQQLLTELEQRTEDELRESRSLLRRITNAIPGAVFRLEQEHKKPPFFPFISDGAAELFGVSIEELLVDATLVWNRLPLEGRHEFVESWERSRALQERWNHEFQIETRLGQKWIRVSAVPEPLPGDRGTAFNGVFMDITSEKNVESAFHRSQKMEALGALAAGVAHNFNNTLAGILPNLEFCLQRSPPDLQEALEDARHAAHTAADVVDQLMLLSRQDRNAEHKILRIDQVLRGAVAICERTFDPRIRISLELPNEAVYVNGQSSQLEQVFLNLCINSRDAVAGVAEPSISIRTTISTQPGADAFQLLEEQRYVVVAVTDNGSGMDGRTQARLGEPFFTTKEPGHGTGLGLASAFGIMKEHGGTLHCQSQPGQGTTFSVWLPMRDESQASGSLGTSNTPFPAPSPPARLLLIDDDFSVRRSYGRLLQREGYEVILAGDGLQGLERFDDYDGNFNAVILDLSMPKMSGDEVLKRLLAKAPGTRIVILSGHATPSSDLQGAQAVLKKPASRERLLAELSRQGS